MSSATPRCFAADIPCPLQGIDPSSDLAGEAADVGTGVDDFKEGDRIMGTLQEATDSLLSPTNHARESSHSGNRR